MSRIVRARQIADFTIKIQRTLLCRHRGGSERLRDEGGHIQ
jgi:hypothetical protein